MKICNHPHERSFINYPWVYWDDSFSIDELSAIDTMFSHKDLMRAEVGYIPGNVDEEYRRSNISWIYRDPENSWIFERMNWAAEQINNNWYCMDLNGYSSFQWTEYDAEDNGEYVAHMDLQLLYDNSKDGIRKLSLALLISDPEVDFDGGDFEFSDGEDWHKMEAKKGRIIAFPSWIIHRVRPVTKGHRKSLVTWVTGPKFR